MLVAAILGAAVPNVAAAGDYTVDPNHTYPSLEFSHMGLSIWRGKFNKTSGKVTLDRGARTGSVEILVDAASVDFGHDKTNEFALGADWLNVAEGDLNRADFGMTQYSDGEAGKIHLRIQVEAIKGG